MQLPCNTTSVCLCDNVYSLVVFVNFLCFIITSISTMPIRLRLFVIVVTRYACKISILFEFLFIFVLLLVALPTSCAWAV